MMKRALGLCLALCMLLAAVSALADLTVAQENLVIYDGDDAGYYFAIVRNDGNAPAAMSSGELVLRGEDGSQLVKEGFVTASPYAFAMQPGESVFVSEFLWDSALQNAAVSSYSLTLKENPYPHDYEMIPSTGFLMLGGNQDNYVVVSFTNITDHTVFDFTVCAAVMDPAGELLLTASRNYDGLGVNPGSTVSVRMDIDYRLVKYFSDRSTKFGVVDSRVYHLSD